MRAPTRRPRLLRQTPRALDVRAWQVRQTEAWAVGLVAKHVPRGVAGELERALGRERRV